MVLTRLMATTNNVQEDELQRSTALKRQVQTLAAAVECLTKQNHDLEEQLRQRGVRHNIQEENQGDSSERRGPERSEGSNEPSRPEHALSHGYNPTTHPCGNAGDEGTNGGHDERPQGTRLQRPRQFIE